VSLYDLQIINQAHHMEREMQNGGATDAADSARLLIREYVANCGNLGHREHCDDCTAIRTCKDVWAA
jgi:hypothetical protein